MGAGLIVTLADLSMSRRRVSPTSRRPGGVDEVGVELEQDPDL
jgi:hypothetical protein